MRIKQELASDLKKAQIPKFNGKHDGEHAEVWLEEAKTYFSMNNLLLETKTMSVTYKFQDISFEWWNAYKVEHGI